MPETKRTRRLTRQLDDLPGLFDYIDISRDDIAGSIIAELTSPAIDPDPEISDIDLGSLQSRRLLRFISFGSGSSGNCAYIGTDAGGLLIDAGVDSKFVVDTLLHNGIDMSSVRGILLTHDHGDHVKYAYSFLRANRHFKLFCTPKTLNGLLRRHNISRRIKDYHSPIFKEFPFEVAGLSITPFEVSHDGTDNVGYSITGAGVNFVIVTDTGCITDRADFYMRSANALMIESNYDAEMLRHGSYQEHLKARIASEIGHLDNAVTAGYLASIASPELTHIFLCHLSHDNNCPEVALDAVSRALTDAGHALSQTPLGAGIHLSALPRFAASPLFVFSSRGTQE